MRIRERPAPRRLALRILIDAHMAGERESGNERYIVNLIAALQKLDLPAEFVIAASHPELFSDGCQVRGNWRVEKVSATSFRRLAYELPRLVCREKVDLMHVTYAAPVWPGCRVVTTIHDVSFRPHPEWFSQRDLVVLRTGVGLTLAAGAEVITISEYSKEEIIRYYGVHRDRVHVAYLAGDPCFGLRPNDVNVFLERLGIRGGYVLAVGNLQPRKNLKRLIKAFALIKQKKGLQVQLVIAGKAQWQESEVVEEVDRLGLTQDVCFPGYVSDAELITLYRQASVFVYPSLYEGFGLPVLEAMSCGVPVVTSHCTSIPEVAGDAALMVDPMDADALADALCKLLVDSSLQESLRNKGRARAESFTWENTARKTWEVYKKMGGIQ